MTQTNLRYAPDYRVTINDEPIPSALRGSISSVSYENGLEGADRVELTLVNDNLRWLDHPLLALDNTLTLSIGYAPDALEQVFVGEITGQSATFPNEGGPTVTVIAQDLLHRLQKGTKERWFAISTPIGHFPIADPMVARHVSQENLLFPITDPIGAALAVLVGGIEVVMARGDSLERQKLIRKQTGQSDFDFLQNIAQENGWEMLIEHTGTLGGHKLRFMSPLSELSSDLTLKYGQSLINFTPKVSDVGQFIGVSTRLWLPKTKMEFNVTVSWDWDRSALDLSISPGFGSLGGTGKTLEELKDEISKASKTVRDDLQKNLDRIKGPTISLLGEPVTLASAGRVILSKLIPSLNKRLTGSGSTVGNPGIKAGTVLRLEGLGEQFGGLYRVTSATHTIDSGGYRTSFEVRKEIWFGSIPLAEQGAVQASVLGQRVGSIG